MLSKFARKCNKLKGLHKMLDVKMVRVIALAVLCVGLIACASQSAPKSMGPDERAELTRRVTERWQAMEVKDFAKTYDYTTPNYREVFSKALYLNKFSYSVDWELTAIEVVNYDAQAAVASVVVRVMSKPAKQTLSASIFGATPITLNESWIFVEGQWWHNAKG
jgi:hypothetical protein